MQTACKISNEVSGQGSINWKISPGGGGGRNQPMPFEGKNMKGQEKKAENVE